MDAMDRFCKELVDLEEDFYWWWHCDPEDIRIAEHLLCKAGDLLKRAKNARDLPGVFRRRICRDAFMIHQLCICFDRSGMREKLPNCPDA